MIADKSHSRRSVTLFLALGGYLNFALSFIQGLFLVPLYLHCLGDRTYGLWLASGGILAWLSVMDLGLSSMMTQSLAKYFALQDFKQSGRVFYSGIVMFSILGFIILLCTLPLAFWLPGILKTATSESFVIQGCFVLSGLVLAVNNLNDCLRGGMQAMLQPVPSMTILLTSRIVGLVVSVVFLLQGKGLWSIPGGNLVASGLALLFNLLYIKFMVWKCQLEMVGERTIYRKFLRVGGVAVFSRLGQAIVRDVEPLLITITINPETATCYSLSKKIAEMASTLSHVLDGAVFPMLSHYIGHKGQNECTEMTGNIFHAFFTVSLIGFSLFVVLNRGFLEIWVGKQYQLSQLAVTTLGVAYGIGLIKHQLTRILAAAGDFLVPSLVVLFDSLLIVVLMIVLANKFGLIGIPAAIMFCSALSSFYLARRAIGTKVMAVGQNFNAGYMLDFVICFVFAHLLSEYNLGKTWANMALSATITLCFFSLILNKRLARVYAFIGNKRNDQS